MTDNEERFKQVKKGLELLIECMLVNAIPLHLMPEIAVSLCMSMAAALKASPDDLEKLFAIGVKTYKNNQDKYREMTKT